MVTFAGNDLACVRGDRLVFEQISFQMQEGAALVLVGRNGAGKSSLLRIMAGLLAPASGTMTWNGSVIANDREAHTQRLCYVGHADALKPSFNALENLEFWASLGGRRHDAHERCLAALSEFGIAQLAQVPGRYLSAGQKRRLALCRLLVSPARLWLLDEPRTALDVDAAARLDAVIAKHRREGGMVAIALHGAQWPADARRLSLDPADAVPPC